MLDIVVRGDSLPDMVVDMNRKLILFILHGNDLYYWSQLEKGLQLVGSCDSENLTKINDEQFQYMMEEKVDGIDYFIINQVNTVFSTFLTNEIYKETIDPQKKIWTYCIDYRSKILVILYRARHVMGKKTNKMKVVDLTTQK